MFTKIDPVSQLEFIYYTYCCLYGGAISFQHFWHFQSQFPWKVMHCLSNVLLIRHNLMSLHKLIQFDFWNSFIRHILVYREVQYRFNILGHFQSKFPLKVMHWLSNVLLIWHYLMCLQNLTQFYSWMHLFHILLFIQGSNIVATFWTFSTHFQSKVVRSRSSFLLIRHSLTCLRKLTQFHSWNSFIAHIVAFTEVQYRFNILDLSNTPPIESYELRI